MKKNYQLHYYIATFFLGQTVFWTAKWLYDKSSELISERIIAQYSYILVPLAAASLFLAFSMGLRLSKIKEITNINIGYLLGATLLLFVLAALGVSIIYKFVAILAA